MILGLPSLRRSKIYPAIKIKDVNYADDLALVTDKTNKSIILLHKIEHAAKEIGLYIIIAMRNSSV